MVSSFTSSIIVLGILQATSGLLGGVTAYSFHQFRAQFLSALSNLMVKRGSGTGQGSQHRLWATIYRDSLAETAPGSQRALKTWAILPQTSYFTGSWLVHIAQTTLPSPLFYRIVAGTLQA